MKNPIRENSAMDNELCIVYEEIETLKSVLKNVITSLKNRIIWKYVL